MGANDERNLPSQLSALTDPNTAPSAGAWTDSNARIQALEILVISMVASRSDSAVVAARFAKMVEGTLRAIEHKRNPQTQPYFDALRSRALRLQMSLELGSTSGG